MRPKLTVDQFWTKGIRQGACLIWVGSTTPKGYGEVYWNGRSRRVHCVAWELVNGCPVPDGRVICHNCPGGDNPACYEPSHLWTGTVAQNNADKAAKGRASTGQRHSSAKLTETQVLEIRSRLASGRAKQRELAIEYGVSHGLIAHIAVGRNWKHLL